MRRTLSKISQGAVASRIKQNVFNKRLNCSRLRHWVRGPSTSLEMSLFDRAHTTSYWRSTV